MRFLFAAGWGALTLSPRANAPVPAALLRFTARFGMGRGGSRALKGHPQPAQSVLVHRAPAMFTLLLPRVSSRWSCGPSPAPAPRVAAAHACRIRQALGPQCPSAAPVAGRPPRTCPAAHLAAPLPASRCEVTRLVAGFALRCIQRFALPTVATQAAGRPTPAPPAGRPARSSRTRASPTQSPIRPHRIETELSHDVLNPARVPLSWANSPTLGTDSSPRMRRADIEVPNPAVDLNSWAGSACYPRGSFYPVRYGPSTRYRRITRPAFRPCAACLPCSQAPLCPCTPWVVTIHPEGTIGRLRYALGGDRPSQTPHQPGFHML